MARGNYRTRKQTDDTPKSQEVSQVEAQEATKPPRPKMKKFKCIVHHLDMDEANKNVPIFVQVNGKKREFAPGQEVELLESQVNALRGAAIDWERTVPPDSAYYTEPSPAGAAQKNNPDCTVRVDRKTGLLILSRHQPRFSVQVLEEV